MSLSYLIKPAARIDIDAAYDWYEVQQAGRGGAFLNELYAKLSEVRQTPLLFGLVSRKVRAAQLPHSQYVLYYEVEPNQVVVTAVLHTRANPRTWQRRK
jgi:plasmid stabilization system protein ParE